MECKELLAVTAELNENSRRVSGEQVAKLADMIASAHRVFIAGAGRSGFAARGFANRLMHLGKETYFVGETTTPSIRKGDLLVIGSGSGTTDGLVSAAKKAKQAGAMLATLTMFPEQTIGQMCDAVIKIPGVTPKRGRGDSDTAVSIQPMGTLFEQLCWLVYDSLVLLLMKELGQTAE